MHSLFPLETTIAFVVIYLFARSRRLTGGQSVFAEVSPLAERLVPIVCAVAGIAWLAATRTRMGWPVGLLWAAVSALVTTVAYMRPGWRDVVFGARGWTITAIVAYAAVMYAQGAAQMTAAGIILLSCVAVALKPRYALSFLVLCVATNLGAQQSAPRGPRTIALSQDNVIAADSVAAFQQVKDDIVLFHGAGRVEVRSHHLIMRTDSLDVLLMTGTYDVVTGPGEVILTTVKGHARAYQGHGPMNKQLPIEVGEKGRMTMTRREKGPAGGA